MARNMIRKRPGPLLAEGHRGGRSRRWRILFSAFMLILTAAAAVTNRAAAAATLGSAGDLTADGTTNPLGIDDTTPQLRWAVQSAARAVTQTAYQVLVATSPDRLTPDRADMWVTDHVASADMQTGYAGRPLAARTRYYWTVRVWVSTNVIPAPGGRVSDWAKPAWFETAYTSPSQWQGTWISGPPRETAVQTAAQGNADDACCRIVNTTLSVDAAPGDTNAKVGSISAIQVGASLKIGDETVTVASVGSASSSTTLSAATAAGDTSFTVPSSTVIAVGDRVMIDTGASAEDATVVSVTPGGRRNPTTIGVQSPLTNPHAQGAPVFDPGTGVTLSTPLTKAHAAGTSVTGTNTPTDVCRPPGTPGFGSGGFTNAGSCAPIRPTEFLRKAFTVAPVSEHGQVVSARVYSSGLGWDNMTLNGSKTEPGGWLNPGFTSYDQTVLYNTDDVTKLIQQNKSSSTTNVIAAELAAGRYDSASTPNNHGWEFAQWRAKETLRADLYVTYADGTQQLIKSDDTWKTSIDGPTRLADYDLGETYDARKVMPGWDTASYDASSWPNARPVQGPAGRVMAQKEPLNKVVAVHPNTNDTTFQEFSPSTGTYAWDVGKQYTGWATVKIWGATPGQVIRIVFVERRNAVSVSNGVVTGPQQGALVLPGGLSQMYYVSDGAGTNEANAEVYTPHTWFGGFQWVLVSGSNGEPLPSNVHAMVTSVSEMHTAMPQTGTFTSDNAVLNRIYTALNGSGIGDYEAGQSMDTPTYEKDGWTGDTQLMAPTMSFMYDTQTQYQKSSQDVVDSQAIGDSVSAANTGGSPPMPGGQVGLLIPSDDGYGYCSPTETAFQCGNIPSVAVFKGTNAGDTPIWDAWLQIAPWTLYQFYNDISGVKTAYPAMKKYLDVWIPYWFKAYNANIDSTESHLVNSSLGDWDPPNGSATDATPGENTNVAAPTIISQSSSAYVAYEAQITASAARALAAVDPANASSYLADAAHFDTLYNDIKADYNSKFWNATAGYYQGDNTGSTFSQGAQILPLAFGLVPDGQQVPLETKLVNDVVNVRHNHEEVGIAAARWFFPVLTHAARDGVPGAAEAAYAVALQTTYPSYGWFNQLGWTGIGENWDSTSRTRDHQMFGTIGQWMYEELAGLKSTSPGFQTVDVRPLIVANAGINHVAATYDSVRGPFTSSWTRSSDGTITMHVTIPANTTATVYVPASSPSSVTETGSGKAVVASKAPGVSLVRQSGDSIAYKVGGGTYTFVVNT